MVRSKKLTGAGSDCADTPKANQAELPLQNQPVFELSSEHIAIQVTTSRVAAKLIVRAIDAVAIEGWRATCAAPKEVVSKDLLVVKAQIFVEGESVGLKGIFAAEVIREEVASEVNHAAL